MSVALATCTWWLLAFASLVAAQGSAAVPKVDPVSYLSTVKPPSYNVAEYWANFKPAKTHAAIVAAAPDTWQVLPKELDPKFKNPCWTDEASGRFRCMPYFQIIGVSKCGTTDLYNRLKRHPDLADGAKGPHFWDECPYPPKGACTAPPTGDFDGYVNLFERGAQQIAKHPTAICGEASSNTFTGVFTYVRGLARLRTNVTLAELIREAQPYQRLVVIMRDPVDRYYSAFHYYRRSPRDPFEGPDKFHAKATQDIKRWNECVARSGVFACIKKYDPQQLVKGMYSEFVEAWTRHFPADQLLFMRTEDYKAAPQQHISALIDFLGMRQLSEEEITTLMKLRRFNAQSEKYPPMWPQTRKMLEDFYRPFNQKLAKLMQDDRYLWLDSAAKAAAKAAAAGGGAASTVSTGTSAVSGR